MARLNCGSFIAHVIKHKHEIFKSVQVKYIVLGKRCGLVGRSRIRDKVRIRVRD